MSDSLLPRSALLAWWGTAWLRGDADSAAVLAVVPGAGVLELLTAARRDGATLIGTALPVEGDPLGLGGPSGFTRAALDRGEAAVADHGTGWVPVGQGWEPHAARRRSVPDVGEADRALRQALLGAADRLAALEVARWRPEVADALMNLRRPAALTAPSGVPARCLDLASRGLQAEGIVEMALVDDGAAVGVTDMNARRDVLLDLERAARRAIVAACSPEVWPAR